VYNWALSTNYDIGGGEMMNISVIERRIDELRRNLARDMEILLNLEDMKHRYYKHMMGGKERYDD